MQTSDCGIIILAAGNASRLGSAKQLLPFRHKTLLQHSLDEALALAGSTVVVVTGARQEMIVNHLQLHTAVITHNERWQEGMASSIRAGLSELLQKNTGLSSVIILLCDQPFVSTALLQQLVATKQATGKGIVASVYKETTGVPALFAKPYFKLLLSLQGAEGARKLIAANLADVATIPFPGGSVDIDTREDYDRLLKRHS